MSIEYTWKVNKLKTADVSKGKTAIVQVYWTKTGVDKDGNTGVFEGATPFPVEELTEEFTPFKKVTEKQVLSWIQSKIDEHAKAHIDHQIKKMIDRNKINVVENELPWEK